MRYISIVILAIVLLVSPSLGISSAKAAPLKTTFAPIAKAEVASQNRAESRSEFISYDTREGARARDLEGAIYFLPLDGNWSVRYIDNYSGSNADFAQSSFSVKDWDQIAIPSSPDFYAPFMQIASELSPPELPKNIPVVQYRAEIMIPILWLDRKLFVHVEGVGSAFTLYVGGKEVGYSNDNKTPAEFDISSYVTEGVNSIAIEVYGYSTGDYLSDKQDEVGSLKNIYVYSQPRVRVADYQVFTQADSLWQHAKINVNVILDNDYQQDEDIKVGYDIYDPEGNLKMYNLKELQMGRKSRDTVCFEDNILHAMSRTAWSPDSPMLYEGMIYVTRNKRVVEYIPFRIGFDEKEFIGNDFYHNRQKVDLKIVSCNAEKDKASTLNMLRTIKSYGMNAVYLDYPQPVFFYELCDELGLFVVDQANINCWYRTEDRNVGGSITNDLKWQTAISERVRAMYERTKSHTSVVARSLGGNSGNGYNMYKSYLELKAIDSLSRVVVTYRDLQDEWNSDVFFSDIISKEILFSRPLPSKSRR